MTKNNLKLISVRINPATLDSIDKLASENYYWTRNAIINNILTTVMQTFSDDDIIRMVRYMIFDRGRVDCKFDIVKTPLPY